MLTFQRAAGLAIEDRCGTGSVRGRLLVPPPPAAVAARREREPNDGPGTADVVGSLDAGRSYRLAGAVDDADPFDGYVFTATGAVTLDLDLTFRSGSDVDLDLLVDDRHGHAATCEQATRGGERCRVDVGGDGRHAFDVVVAPAAGSRGADYDLVVSARPTSATAGVAGVAGAGAPVDLDPAVYRGEAAAVAPGELVVSMAPSRAAPGPAGTASTALAAMLGAAGAGDDWIATTVAPDGTALVALPTRTAAAVGSAAGDGLDDKRARAALRARTAAVASALTGRPGVRAAEPNRIVRAARVPRDPLFDRQWAPEVLQLPRAWDVTIGSPTAIVAVVDTGIRSDHPDLAGRLVPGFDFIGDPSRANDGDGIDDDPFDPGDRPGTPELGTFHGTHVAGEIAAATDNPLGVAGVTWRTGIMPLRVLGVGGGTIFDVAQAIRHAAGLSSVAPAPPARPARIINLSLVTTGDDPVLHAAVDAATAAGALVIAAAGNTGSPGFLSPAGFENVVSVAATDRLGRPARYSSFGPSVDLAAPGGDTHHDRDGDGVVDGILSTLLPGRRDYGLLQGTSMAAAQVSGVAALMLGIPGGASAALLRATLVATAVDRGAPGRDDRYGAGLVDASAAVRALAGLPPPSEPVLAVETASLRLADDESTTAIPIRNVGGGTLVLARPTVDDDGAGWLTAELDGDGLRVFVDRDALPTPSAVGMVSLASNGGAATVTVGADVDTAAPEDLGPVTVALRTAPHEVVATTVARAADGYRFAFENVPPGDYEIVASTDHDGDGESCDVGDECGAYPARGAPISVHVFGGDVVYARDFALVLVVDPS